MSFTIINSVSSTLMTSIAKQHNQGGTTTKICARTALVAIPIIGAAESLAAVGCALGSILIFPIYEKPLEISVDWFNSVTVSMTWALGSIATGRMIETEKEVRRGTDFDYIREDHALFLGC